MGESACLVRSFSHPSESSREAKQGDPFHALGESVSFGRFMTEPLAWEKWSAFSHNRYLEEVERFSKPGSVAQKKAYFEAHYKKKAAERAAALSETVSAVASNVLGSVTNNRSCNNFLPDSDLANGENHVDGQLEKDDPNDKVVYPANMSECNSNVERNDLDVDVAEGAEMVAPEGFSLENYNKVEISNQFVNEEDHDKILANIEEKIVNNEFDVPKNDGAEMIIQEGINLENSNQVEISNQFVNKEVHNKIADNEWDVAKVEGTEVVIQEGIDLENPNEVETSNKFISKEKHQRIVANTEEKILKKETAGQENGFLSLTSKKRLANSSSKISTHNRPSKVLLSLRKQSNSIAPRSKKSVEDPMDKKKSSVKSFQKSVQFSSHFVESNTTSSAIRKFGNSRISTTSLNMSKSTSSPLKAITGLQASVSRVLKRPSVDIQTEDKRSKSLLSKSVAGGLTADQKWKSLSTDYLKYPSGNGSKIRSSMTCSPFSFRSEERAAKRKEFFQKLEEKKIAEEAENKHLETRVQDVKKMRQSTGLKARPDEDMCSGSHLPSNHMKKIPLTRPRSPKLGRKSTYSKVPDSSSRPSVNAKSPKCVVEKNKQSTNRSATSRLLKNAHENASPNIQS
ncbi:protein WVD2-like 7 isoform X1 [Ziziphus jujuba]|uniref:Protein WVD2-like 7 isoform X1 n=1 Tax=Ziziphus jujuba TaxID=326968 RepID=A0ABM3I2A2_ZIZJJ|nr:protein WVD2-like 7 isoform X1 [Ziziphus jujuba]